MVKLDNTFLQPAGVTAGAPPSSPLEALPTVTHIRDPSQTISIRSVMCADDVTVNCTHPEIWIQSTKKWGDGPKIQAFPLETMDASAWQKTTQVERDSRSTVLPA